MYAHGGDSKFGIRSFELASNQHAAPDDDDGDDTSCSPMEGEKEQKGNTRRHIVGCPREMEFVVIWDGTHLFVTEIDWWDVGTWIDVFREKLPDWTSEVWNARRTQWRR